MSVAFRRDSDEEHLEPKFERPIPAGPNLVSVRGRDLIVAQIQQIERELADNADEAAAAPLARDLRYWKARQVSAQLAPVSAGDKVEFGTTVTLSLNEAKRVFTIVGHDEADPKAGLLAFTAPLSRAIMGLKSGDFADFGGVADAIEIIAVGPGDAARP